MNTIRIYLTESGRIADLQKDFPLYQGQFQNKLLNVFVPTSILAPIFTSSGAVSADYVASTSTKIGMTYTARDGSIKTSKNYYMRYLKTLMYKGVEYALYERKLPKEFTFYAGQGENSPVLIINVVNIEQQSGDTPPLVLSVITSQTCHLDVMQSTFLDRDELDEPSELENLNAQVQALNAIMPKKQDKEDENIALEQAPTEKTVVGAINKLGGLVKTAQSSADTAQQTAETAQTTADNATTLANNAVATANGAVATANEAKTTAQTAETNANSAVDKADNAIDRANKAYEKAANNVYAVGFMTLQEAITAVNGYDNTVLKTNDNILVVAQGSPDLYVTSVEATNIPYNFTTVDKFNDDLVKNTVLQIGYYKVAFYETDGQPVTVAYQNVVVKSTDWVTSTEFADFPYEAKIELTDFVDYTTVPQVVFDIADTMSGNYAPICKSGDKCVYIYGKVQNEITLKTVITFAPNVNGASVTGGGYNNRGKWVASTTYDIDDLVYTDNGQYVCIEGITSTISPEQDTTHWQATFVATAPEALPQEASALKSGSLPTSGWSTIDEGWKQNTLPASRKWSAITYGNGKFVAVAGLGSILTDKGAYSTDGITWTEMTLPSSNYWFDVTYGNGKFIAVAGDSDKGAYSTDGITWTEFTMPASRSWLGVTYGNGKFVAVAGQNSAKGAYSADGISWTEMSMPASRNWYNVTYGDGKFVAVAHMSNKGAYSTDGINWEETSMLSSNSNWRSVIYGNGKFVAVAWFDEKGAYSADGIHWTRMSMPANLDWYSVTYGNGKFVAVAGGNSANGAYSIDGITWTEFTMPASRDWKSVTYGDGNFVAVASSSANGAYWGLATGTPIYTITDTSITANSDVLMELTDEGGVKAYSMEAGKMTVIRDTVPTQPIPYTYKVKQTNASGQFTVLNHYVGVTSVNGQTGAVTIAVPTKTSELTNDSGFITQADIPTTPTSLPVTYKKVSGNLPTMGWADSTPSWIGQNVLTWSNYEGLYYIQGGTEDLGLVEGGSYTATVTIDGTDYEQDNAFVTVEGNIIVYLAYFNNYAVIMQIDDHCSGLDEQGGLLSGNGYVVGVRVTGNTVPSSIVIKSCSAVSGGIKATISNSAIKTNSAVTMYIDYDGKISAAKKIDGSLTVSAKTTPTVDIPYSIEIIDTNTEGLFEIINDYVPSVPTKTSELTNDSGFAKTTEANTWTGVQTFSNADGIKTDRVHNLDNNDAWYNFDGSNNRFGSPSRPTIIRTSEARPRAQVPSGETTVTKEIALLEDIPSAGEWVTVTENSATLTEAGTYQVLFGENYGVQSIIYWDGSTGANGIPSTTASVTSSGTAVIAERYLTVEANGVLSTHITMITVKDGSWTQTTPSFSGFKYRKIN